MQSLFEEKKVFKLICGAGNEDVQEVEKLVAVYAKAGCKFFDFSNNQNVLFAAKKGLDFAIKKEDQKDYHFCISVGIKDDPHFQKAQIDYEKCKHCEQCIYICPQKAISSYFKVDKKKCIGCLKCKQVCKHNAITIYNQQETNEFHLPQYPEISCVELHAISDELDLVEKIWDNLNEQFPKMLSLCLGRTKLGDEKLLNLITKLVQKRKPYTTIIQADGSPISGGNDDFKSTLQAVATAELIEKAKLPCYVIMSGGTNSKTAQLVNQCNIHYDGIAIGSYARKIIKELTQQQDFLTNSALFNEAVKKAKTLIESIY